MGLDISVRDLGWASKVEIAGVCNAAMLETVRRGLAALLAEGRPLLVDVSALECDDLDSVARVLESMDRSGDGSLRVSSSPTEPSPPLIKITW